MTRSLLSVVGAMLLSMSLSSQTLTPSDLLARGEIDHEVGYIPKSLESLVGSSTIIFIGRFEDHISHEDFFGYDETRESFKERLRIDDRQADRLAIPKSEYSVQIDDLLLGDPTLANKDGITYRIFENAPSDRTFTDPSIQRIFFLVRNPDGTYSPMGPASVLNKKGNQYLYDALTKFPGDFENRELDFISGISAEELENRIKEEIRNQYPDL